MIEVLMIEDDIELVEFLSEFLFQYGIYVINYDELYIGISAVNI